MAKDGGLYSTPIAPLAPQLKYRLKSSHLIDKGCSIKAIVNIVRQGPLKWSCAISDHCRNINHEFSLTDRLSWKIMAFRNSRASAPTSTNFDIVELGLLVLPVYGIITLSWTYCEDLVFSLRLKNGKYIFWFQRRINVFVIRTYKYQVFVTQLAH